MSIPSVAIITRTKDRPLLLRRTLESVLAQSYPDWVWVVVNSGDAGLVEALVDEFGEALAGRATVIHMEQQLLMGAASNVGVRGSDSKFLVLLDDDDTWDSEFLSKAVASLEVKLAPGMAGVVTQTMRVEEVEEAGVFVETEREPFNDRLRHVNLFDLASVNRFTVNAFLYERAAFEKVGGYREDLPVLDDWDFNLRFLQNYDVAVIPEALANYHLRPQLVDGAAANSQVAGDDLHQFFYASIVNDHIRRDLESGQAGLGMLIGAAGGQRAAEEKLDRIGRKLGRMSTKLGRVDARTKEMKDRR